MLYSTLIVATLSAMPVLAFPAAMNVDNGIAMRALEDAVARRAAGRPPKPAAKRATLPFGLDALPAGVVTGGTGSTPYSFNFGSLPITDTLNIPFKFDVPGILSVGKKPIPESLFIAPKNGDQRGQCPGLNIMANYGFLDHSGITTPGEIIYGLSEMLGNTIDIALGLIGFTLKAGAIDLSTMKFSIGQADSRTSGSLTNLLGGPVPGLFSPATHNRFEVDGTTDAEDEYFNTPGLNTTRMAAAVQRANTVGGGLFNDNWIGAQKYAAWSECIATNPTCTWSPATTMLFYAAQAYAELTMPSADNGVPNPATVDACTTFWGYNATSNTAQPSRLFPGKDGVWYRRAVPINAANLVQDGVAGFLTKPTQFGSNNGRNINSFTSIENPFAFTTPGVGCFIINTAIQTGVPASYGLASASVLNIVKQLFAPAQAVLGCTNID